MLLLTFEKLISWSIINFFDESLNFKIGVNNIIFGLTLNCSQL